MHLIGKFLKFCFQHHHNRGGVCAKTINHTHCHWVFSTAGVSHHRKAERFLLIKSDVVDPCWETCSGILAGDVQWQHEVCHKQCYFLAAVYTPAHNVVIALSVVPWHLYIFLSGMWNESVCVCTWNKNKLIVEKTAAHVTLQYGIVIMVYLQYWPM